jgi:hypothetical protein
MSAFGQCAASTAFGLMKLVLKKQEYDPDRTYPQEELFNLYRDCARVINEVMTPPEPPGG